MKNSAKNGFSRMTLTLILPFVVIAIAYGAYMLFFIPEPEISGQEEFSTLSANKTIDIEGKNLKSINISIYQGGKKVEVMSDKPGLREMTYSIDVKPRELDLKDGAAIVVIEAKSGFLKKFKQEIRATIDTVPPTIQVMRAPSIINEGSSGVAVLRAKDADIVYIKLGDMKFRAYSKDKSDEPEREGAEVESMGFKKKKGSKRAKTYMVFFPAPFGIDEKEIYYAVAEDRAGNSSMKSLYTRIENKNHKMSNIRIDRSFIDRVIGPLLNESDIDDPVGAFKQVNEEWRQMSHNKLLEIARDSVPEVMWKGRFLQMKNSKVMATYGDERTYLYEGKKISKSVHLGFDLASYAHASVQAANSGIVKFAGNLSIYGYAIILDHGYGLMSLYGHLSSLLVEEGQHVKKGEIIARSGSTGLAGGDHLHFGILVQGYEVSPLYWWDSKWIRVNIEDYLI